MSDVVRKRFIRIAVNQMKKSIATNNRNKVSASLLKKVTAMVFEILDVICIKVIDRNRSWALAYPSSVPLLIASEPRMTVSRIKSYPYAENWSSLRVK